MFVKDSSKNRLQYQCMVEVVFIIIAILFWEMYNIHPSRQQKVKTFLYFYQTDLNKKITLEIKEINSINMTYLFKPIKIQVQFSNS